MIEAAVEALLVQLVDEVRCLRSANEDVRDQQVRMLAVQREQLAALWALLDRKRSRRSRITDDETAVLARLLPLVAKHVADMVFNVHELAVRAKSADEDGLAIGMAINAVGGPEKLGRLFSRANGVTVAGLRLQRVGADGFGVVWRLDVIGHNHVQPHARALAL